MKYAPHPVTCAACGTVFEALREDAKFCDVRCRVSFHRKLRTPVTKPRNASPPPQPQPRNASNASGAGAAELAKLREELMWCQRSQIMFTQRLELATKLEKENAKLEAEVKTLRAALNLDGKGSGMSPRKTLPGVRKLTEEQWRKLMTVLHEDQEPDPKRKAWKNELQQVLNPLRGSLVVKQKT